MRDEETSPLEQTIDQALAAAQFLPRRWAETLPGEHLRALRLSLRISQRHLAEEAHVHQSIICRLERGGDARWSVWKRLFSALGYEVTLMPYSSDEEDARDYYRDAAQLRKDKMEEGRLARWG